MIAVQDASDGIGLRPCVRLILGEYDDVIRIAAIIDAFQGQAIIDWNERHLSQQVGCVGADGDPTGHLLCHILQQAHNRLVDLIGKPYRYHHVFQRVMIDLIVKIRNIQACDTPARLRFSQVCQPEFFPTVRPAIECSVNFRSKMVAENSALRNRNTFCLDQPTKFIYDGRQHYAVQRIELRNHPV